MLAGGVAQYASSQDVDVSADELMYFKITKLTEVIEGLCRGRVLDVDVRVSHRAL